jgi:tritrans,polycis-undecaprenyl-diphosphate synthase [geranylgeranyl-diphosphate specific]
MAENLKIPKHLGIILDGNRRFAKKLAKDPWEGHRMGADTLKAFLDWAKEFDIKELTFYSLSMQNLKRPKIEVDFLIKTIKERFSYFLTDKGFQELVDNDVRVNIFGRIKLLPEPIQEIFNKLEEKTKNFKTRKLNFAMAYGGREEIVDAVKKIVDDVASGKLSKENINTESFGSYLYLNSEPDLIIRPSGAIRTSNFLPWQSIYSEWMFIDKLWPEFTKKDLLSCLQEFSSKERRFGK